GLKVRGKIKTHLLKKTIPMWHEFIICMTGTSFMSQALERMNLIWGIFSATFRAMAVMRDLKECMKIWLILITVWIVKVTHWREGLTLILTLVDLAGVQVLVETFRIILRKGVFPI